MFDRKSLPIISFRIITTPLALDFGSERAPSAVKLVIPAACIYSVASCSETYPVTLSALNSLVTSYITTRYILVGKKRVSGEQINANLGMSRAYAYALPHILFI